MFRAFLDDVCFYDDRLDEKYISDLKVTLEENKAGSFEFTIYPQNSWYQAFEKLNSIVSVEQNGVVIFRGRVLSSEETFDKIRTVTCEGEYAFFNDTVFFPFGYEGTETDENGESVEMSTKFTPTEIFTQIINDYNEQVSGERKFYIGVVDVEGCGEDIDYANMEYTKTIDALDDLAELCGGHFEFRHTESGVFMDWTDKYEPLDQSVKFGKNLLDLVQSIEADEVITGILPHGDTNEETNRPSNISEMSIPATEKHMQMGVHRGMDEEWGPYGHYIVNLPLYEQYGAIIEERSYDGFPADWIDQVLEEVDALTGLSNSIEVEAVDLSWLNDVDFFRIGRSIRVKSDVHGIDDTYDITKLEIDLRDPASNKFTLGKVIANFVEQVIQGDKVKPVDGQSIKILEYAYDYALSDSGTVVPSDDQFSSEIVIEQGKWLWTRVTTKYNDGTETRAYYPSWQSEDAKRFAIRADSTVVVRNDRSSSAQTITFTAEINGYTEALPIWYVGSEKIGEGGTVTRSIPYKGAEAFTVSLYNGTVLMDTLTLTAVDKSGGAIYLGTCDSAVPTYALDIDGNQLLLMKGDYFLCIKSFGEYIGGSPYVYDGSQFVTVKLDEMTPTEYGEIMSVCLDDALDSDIAENSKYQSWFRRLAAKEAFVRYLIVNNLHVAKGDFEFNVRTIDDEGNELENFIWEIKYAGNVILSIDVTSGTIISNASNFKILPDGSIEAKNGKFEGDITGSTGTFSGQIDCPSFSSLPRDDNEIIVNCPSGAKGQSDALYDAFRNELTRNKYYECTHSLNSSIAYVKWYINDTGHEYFKFYDSTRKTELGKVYSHTEWWQTSYESTWASSSFTVTVKYGEGDVFILKDLPTERNGLKVGQVWRDGAQLMIVT